MVNTIFTVDFYNRNPVVNRKDTYAPEFKHWHIKSGPYTPWQNIVWAKAKDGESKAYVPGKTLLHGAMAVQQLMWCGSKETFADIREAFVNSKGKKNGNVFQWLYDRERRSRDENLRKAFEDWLYAISLKKKVTNAIIVDISVRILTLS